MDDRTKSIIETIKFILIFSLYLILVIAVILLLWNGFTMKGAYDYGLGLQEECYQEFLERERPEYHIYKTYTEGPVRKNFETAFFMLWSIITIIIIVYIIIEILSAIFIITTKQDSVKSLPKIKIWELYVQGLVVAGLVTILGIWSSGINKGAVNINPFDMPPYIVGQGNYDDSEKNKIIKNQIGLIIAIIIILIVLLIIFKIRYYNNTNVIDINLLSNNNQIHFIILAIICLIFIPIISNVIANFQNVVKQYYENETINNDEALNNIIQKSLSNNKIKTEIQQNIVKSNPSILDNGGTLPNLDDDNNIYKDEYYSYVTHILNDADVRAINIPPEIKKYIQPIYLRGEYIIELKKEFAKIYEKSNTTAIKPEEFKEKASNIIKFLITDIQELLLNKKYKELSESEKKSIDVFVSIFNNTIVTNPSFTKVSPFTQEIKDKLTQLRKNKDMRNVVNNYYSTVLIIVYIIAFSFAYIIYHSLYKENTEKTTQVVSIIMFGLILVIGFIGWFTKEFWL